VFSRLSPGQLVFLIVLLVAFSILVQLAVVKWLYDRKRARLKREQAEAERAARAPKPPDIG